jgi:hypothetical protein
MILPLPHLANLVLIKPSEVLHEVKVVKMFQLLDRCRTSVAGRSTRVELVLPSNDLTDVLNYPSMRRGMRAESLTIIKELGHLLFLLVLLAVAIRYLEDVLQRLWRWPTQNVLLPRTRILLDFRCRLLFKDDVNALIVGSSLGRAQLLLVAFDRIEDREAGLLVEQSGALASLPLFGVGG